MPTKKIAADWTPGECGMAWCLCYRTAVTELAYRLKPVAKHGTEAMDRMFGV
jgi:hypothetical protein